VGLHEADRHACRPLVGGRPPRHHREPAHGAGGGRGGGGREAVRPRRARPHGDPRPEGRRHAHARDRCRGPRPVGVTRPLAVPGREAEAPKPTKYYARQAGTGLVAVVPATLADDLAKGMGELRAKRLLEVATYETEGFEVVTGGAKKAYAKSTTKDKDGFDKTQWKRTAPDAEGPRDDEGRGRALQDGRGRGVRVRGPAAAARRLRARRARPQGDGEGEGRELDRGRQEGRRRLRPPQRRRRRPEARPGEGRGAAEGLLAEPCRAQGFRLRVSGRPRGGGRPAGFTSGPS
jgi:hypothetical protein